MCERMGASGLFDAAAGCPASRWCGRGRLRKGVVVLKLAVVLDVICGVVKGILLMHGEG